MRWLLTPIVFKVIRSKVKVTVTLVEKLFLSIIAKQFGPEPSNVGYDYMMTPIVFEVTRSKIKVTVTFSCKTGLNVLDFYMLQLQD